VSDGLAGRQMHPDLRICLDRRISDEPKLISGIQVVEVPVAACEHGPVDGGSEAGGLTFGERWSRIGHRVGLGVNMRTASDGGSDPSCLS